MTLAQIAAPTVVIAAGYDAVSPPPEMQAMAAKMPRAEFHVLRDTSHMGAFLRLDMIVRILRAGE